MANYYMSGYTPPDGVNSASGVKEYQRRLGVKVDGIWGPDTDAAYRASQSAAQAPQSVINWGDSTRDGLFDSYYNAILNNITTPAVSVKKADAGEVSSMWSGILRPSVDAAIGRRESAAQKDMAELDADAESRGMGASSYVTAMKAREQEDAQEDIGELEAQYGAVLAEKIYDTLYKYDQLNLTAQKYNADAYSASAKTALNMASDWYTQYLAQQSAAAKAASSGKSSGGLSTKKSSLSSEDYMEYVRNLTSAQQGLLFNSGADYWSTRRDEIYSALGSTLFNSLKKKYGG